MKKITNSEIKKIYRSKVKPHVKSLTLERKKLLKRAIVILIVLIPVAIFIAVSFSNPAEIFDTLIFGIIIVLGITTIAIYSPYKKFKNNYKRKIIKTALEAFFPNSSYSTTANCSQSSFNELELFSSKANRFNSEDEISGVIGKTKFKMSEINAKRETGSGKNRHVEQIFRGFLYQVDFNKNFNADTLVQIDFAENKLGSWLGSKLQGLKSKGNRKLVKLEDVRFEKYYVVYSTDPQEARYILSPKLMEAIMSLRAKLKRDIQFAFKHNQFFITLPTFKNYFEPRFFGPLINVKDLKEIIYVYNVVGSLIEELDLNTRIWTKD
jgi:hypothetical protein